MVRSLFGDLYDIDMAILDGVMFGMPVRRKRLYCVLTLRSRVLLTGPLSELPDVCRSTFACKPPRRTLVCLPGVDDGMSTSVVKRASDYPRGFRRLGQRL